MEYPRSWVAHWVWCSLGWMWGWWKRSWEILKEEVEVEMEVEVEEEEGALVCLQKLSSSWPVCVSE